MMDVNNLIYNVWHIVAIGLGLFIPVWATGHVVLHKRDSRSAIAWVGLIWLVPLVGALLYAGFGVNRIRHKAAQLRRNLDRYRAQAVHPECLPEDLPQHLPERNAHLAMLARVVGRVVDRPLMPGNRIEPLVNDEEAFPAMLAAIRAARQSIACVTYLFGRDAVGLAFAQALGDAVRRGVAVRVLVDAMGARYSFPTILRALRREGITHAQFMPTFRSWRLLALNMRTHRKILVVDGRVGFAGGMNLRAGAVPQCRPRKVAHDIHFRVEGPVVTHLQEVFTDDWLFATGEALRGAEWFPETQTAGPVFARGVTEGPDEHFEKLLWTLLGALSIARDSIRIMTPYFLPDPELVSALNLAAMRGVQVDIILPEHTNWPFVQWASRAMWSQMLQHGCRIWLTPPPFDHSKLMLVDGCWVLLGSANWDARSLRLNFEFNVECYDVELARQLGDWIETKRTAARPVTQEAVNSRSMPARLRDGIAHLMTPYL